ncbi:MELT-like protein, partial [Mya arenaria]
WTGSVEGEDPILHSLRQPDNLRKSDSRKETLPVREIQSVKAVRKGIRDIPNAFEIFTTDQNYVFKAKGQQDIEPWVQCIHLAVAKAQNDGECTVVETSPYQPFQPDLDLLYAIQSYSFCDTVHTL